jgi:site-specific DNA-cytosine methylase
MGYQVQFTVLQAGEYCLPQSRQRVFFWASLPGNELPNYPRPRTKFSGICATSWHRRHDYSGGAPLPQVTIGDTLTDLPAFDWVNPHLVAGQSDEENLDRLQRATKIRQVKVRKHKNFVGYDKQSYACRPLSEYQRRLRKGVPHNTVLNHVTIKYYDEPRWNKRGGLENAKTEQVCSIPMRPGADHRDLPEKLKPWCLSHPDSRASKYKFYPGRYGRLDMEKHFETCLTEIDPNGKNGTVSCLSSKQGLRPKNILIRLIRPCILPSIVWFRFASMHEQWAFLILLPLT